MVYINSLAKAKAFDLWVVILGLLMLIFAFMNLDMVVLLLLVGVYLSGWAVYLGYMAKYSKEI